MTKTKRTLATALCLSLSAPLALAHQGAKGVVKERMDTMGQIAAHVKSTSQMLRGTTELDRAKLAEAMRQIANYAMHMPDMFPEGTHAAPSEAALAIWEDTEAFDALFADLEHAAQNMADIALEAKKPALNQAFAEVAKTCKACHADFRINRD